MRRLIIPTTPFQKNAGWMIVITRWKRPPNQQRHCRLFSLTPRMHRRTTVSLQQHQQPSHHGCFLPITSSRSLATEAKPPKQKKKKSSKQSKAKKKARQRDQQLRYNDRQNRRTETGRQNNLHPAAKMKRILSACDFWFSDGHLRRDVFLTRELNDFGGWARIGTLANFDKLRGWTDTSLVFRALDHPAVEKRYRVVVNRAFVEAGVRNRLRRNRQTKLNEQFVQQQQAEEQKERKDRMQELEAQLNKMREEYYRPLYKMLLDECDEYEKNQDATDRALEEAKRQEVLANMDPVERWLETARDKIRTAKEWFAAPEQVIDMKEEEEEEDDDDEMMWQWYWEGHCEEALMEEDEEFAELRREMESLEHQEEHEEEAKWLEADWDRRMMRDFGEVTRDNKFHDDQSDHALYPEVTIRGDDDLTIEELPFPVVDDGSDLLKYALVRHRRKTLDIINSLSDVPDDDDMGDDDMGDDYEFNELDSPLHDDDDDDDLLVLPEGPPRKPVKFKKPQTKHLPKYTSQRKVHVIKNPAQLRAFCIKLKKSLERYSTSSANSNNNTNATTTKTTAIGFDVEYCTLEMDIRNTLPAMLQLASPQGDQAGIVGLIWLDKFPDFGRQVMNNSGDSNSDDSYADLLSILSDPHILKVGVGTCLQKNRQPYGWRWLQVFLSHYFFLLLSLNIFF